MDTGAQIKKQHEHQSSSASSRSPTSPNTSALITTAPEPPAAVAREEEMRREPMPESHSQPLRDHNHHKCTSGQTSSLGCDGGRTCRSGRSGTLAQLSYSGRGGSCSKTRRLLLVPLVLLLVSIRTAYARQSPMSIRSRLGEQRDEQRQQETDRRYRRPPRQQHRHHLQDDKGTADVREGPSRYRGATKWC